MGHIIFYAARVCVVLLAKGLSHGKLCYDCRGAGTENPH